MFRIFIKEVTKTENEVGVQVYVTNDKDASQKTNKQIKKVMKSKKSKSYNFNLQAALKIRKWNRLEYNVKGF